MLLGISGASFFLGALNQWYYYILGALFLAVGIYFQYRHSVAGSLAPRRRNRWLFPLVTVTSGVVAYLVISFILTPLLVSFDTKPAVLPQTELRVDGIPDAKPTSLRQAELRVEGMT
ncbi:MAG: hypothetical protein HY663_03820 [Chloroflexi bacterium]|nr:hypothetical protein [Chloroflexota bacterium]